MSFRMPRRGRRRAPSSAVESDLPERPRPDVYQEEFDDSSDDVDDTLPEEDWTVHPEATSNRVLEQQQYLILYCVTCSGNKNHEEHEAQSFYLDHPKLFKGDSKMSALRGQKKVEDYEDYTKRHNKVTFIVRKNFDCQAYVDNEHVQKLFRPLPTPDDPKIPDEVLPYFFSLRSNGPEAGQSWEYMHIVSDILRDAVAAITGMSDDELVYLATSSRNMAILQDSIYYFSRSSKVNMAVLTANQQLHLDSLLEYMQWAHGDAYEEADALIAQGLIKRKYLGKLFGTNQILVTNTKGHHQGYMLKNPPSSNESSSIYSIILELWSWHFNGNFYKQHISRSLVWPSYANEDEAIPISDLDIYPLRYASTEALKQMRARAKTFWKCRKARFVAYDPPNAILEFNTSNPRYMVDVDTYQKMHGESSTTSLPQDTLSAEDLDADEPPGDSFILLLPHEIHGFGMHDKKWRSLLVEFIKDIDWNEGAFDLLVMQHSKKELIKALITVHTVSAKSTDIIEGKGNALIMLLHGGPGTGKTLTAESVAELTRKPLYRVTCGDIGTNAEEVEKYLDSVLLIGTIWGCVVLLDEADVFLEERRETDLQRNALVSVFLRVLEYYDGILILTSNRIGTFDGAFKSRFQLAIHYPALEAPDRHEIWLNFINRLGKTNPDVEIDDIKKHIQELAAVDLNGREIRNIVRTSLQLSQYLKEDLRYKHFEQVLRIAEEFEKHIAATRGYDYSDWVRSRGIRSD